MAVFYPEIVGVVIITVGTILLVTVTAYRKALP
jgi:hypothetical protein